VENSQPKKQARVRTRPTGRVRTRPQPKTPKAPIGKNPYAIGNTDNGHPLPGEWPNGSACVLGSHDRKYRQHTHVMGPGGDEANPNLLGRHVNGSVYRWNRHTKTYTYLGQATSTKKAFEMMKGER